MSAIYSDLEKKVFKEVPAGLVTPRILFKFGYAIEHSLGHPKLAKKFGLGISSGIIGVSVSTLKWCF